MSKHVNIELLHCAGSVYVHKLCASEECRTLIKMEFEEQFAVIQGLLITTKKKLGTLDTLSSNKDADVSKMKNVTKILNSVINGSDKIKKRAKDSKLRKMHMFLVLNTNLLIKSALEEDDNCGHIVGCTPVISKDLFVELVYTFTLHKYFCEVLVYTPFSLGTELLEAAIHKTDTLEFSEKVSKAEEYGTAVYHKFRLLDSKTSEMLCLSAKLSLFKYFKTLLTVFQKPNTSDIPQNSCNELYRLAGLTMKNLLGLFNNCLKLYIDTTDVKLDYLDIYTLQIPECLDDKCNEVVDDNCNEEKNITSETFIKEVLNTCNSNFQALTVDMFLYWADCFVSCETTKSVQQDICEAMYHCAENLQAAKNIGIKSSVAEQVMSALMSMGAKPHDEDDEIKEADLTRILKNVSDETKSQRKWFKALVQYPLKLSDEIYFKSLEKHLDFADTEDLKSVVQKTVIELTSPEPVKNLEALRNFALTGIKQLQIDQQLIVLDWFFLKYGINELLKKDAFNMEMIHIFNKSVHVSKEGEELVSEFIYLCLQSPNATLARMIYEGISGTEQAALMIKILRSLTPVKNMYVTNKGVTIYSKEERDSFNITAHFVQNIMKKNLNDKEKYYFAPFIVLLIKASLIDGSKLIREILLPHVHDTYNSSQVDLLLCLETLCAIMDEKLLSDTKQLCPLLVFLSSILKRWTISTFSTRSVLVCEKIQLLLKGIFANFLINKPEEDREIYWLRHKLKRLTPLDKCYFKDAWSKFGKSWTTNLSSKEMALLELMHNDPDDVPDAANSLCDIQNDYISFSLAKILPLCTPFEWKSLAKHMGKLYRTMESETGLLKLARIFTDSLLILIYFVEWPNSHCCLNYCVRNVGIIIKEDILPRLDGSQPEALMIIFQKLCYGLGLLPANVREQCCTVIANILVDIVQKIADSPMENILICNLEDMTRTLGLLHGSKALQVLANKLVAVTRTD